MHGTALWEWLRTCVFSMDASGELVLIRTVLLCRSSRWYMQPIVGPEKANFCHHPPSARTPRGSFCVFFSNRTKCFTLHWNTCIKNCSETTTALPCSSQPKTRVFRFSPSLSVSSLSRLKTTCLTKKTGKNRHQCHRQVDQRHPYSASAERGSARIRLGRGSRCSRAGGASKAGVFTTQPRPYLAGKR